MSLFNGIPVVHKVEYDMGRAQERVTENKRTATQSGRQKHEFRGRRTLEVGDKQLLQMQLNNYACENEIHSLVFRGPVNNVKLGIPGEVGAQKSSNFGHNVFRLVSECDLIVKVAGKGTIVNREIDRGAVLSLTIQNLQLSGATRNVHGTKSRIPFLGVNLVGVQRVNCRLDLACLLESHVIHVVGHLILGLAALQVRSSNSKSVVVLEDLVAVRHTEPNIGLSVVSLKTVDVTIALSFASIVVSDGNAWLAPMSRFRG